MKPRIDVITLAVADLDRALAFYRALGLESSGVIATEHHGDDTHPAGTIVMFHLAGGRSSPSIRALSLPKTPASRPDRRGAVNSASVIIVPTRKEVDALLAKAKAAGAPAPVTELHDRPWGITS
jgi:uncharacterized protein